MVKQKGEVIFVNDEKLKRASDIVALVNGKRAVITDRDAEIQTFWVEAFKREEIKGEEAQVRFVYERLGGLVRTRGEQAKAEALKGAIKAKRKAAGRK